MYDLDQEHITECHTGRACYYPVHYKADHHCINCPKEKITKEIKHSRAELIAEAQKQANLILIDLANGYSDASKKYVSKHDIVIIRRELLKIAKGLSK